MGDFCGPSTSSSQYLGHPHHQPILIHRHASSRLHTYPLHHIPSYIFPTSTPPSASAPVKPSSPILPTTSSPILPSHPPPSPHQPDTSKHTQGQASTHDLLQQMLNPLIDNEDAVPPSNTLFSNITEDVPQVEEEVDI